MFVAVKVCRGRLRRPVRELAADDMHPDGRAPGLLDICLRQKLWQCRTVLVC